MAIHKLFGIETVSQCYKSLGVMLSESEASALPTGYEKADSTAEFILSLTKGLRTHSDTVS